MKKFFLKTVILNLIILTNIVNLFAMQNDKIIKSEELIKIVPNAHDDNIVSVIFDEKNKYIITSSYDKSIKIWDLRGNEIKKLSGHDGWVTVLKIKDGLLFSGSADEHVRIWNILSGDCIKNFKAHNGWVNILEVKDNLVISGSYDKSIKIWNFDEPKIKNRKLSHHNERVTSVLISDDCENIISASGDKQIIIWNITNLYAVKFKRLTEHKGCINKIILTKIKNKKYLISASSDKTIIVWDITDLDNITHNQLIGHNSSVVLILSIKNQKLASAACNGEIKIWDIETGACLDTINNAHNGKINSIITSENDKILISASTDKTIKIWDISKINANPKNITKNITGNIKCLCILTGHSAKINELIIINDLLVSVSEDNSIIYWNLSKYIKENSKDLNYFFKNLKEVSYKQIKPDINFKFKTNNINNKKKQEKTKIDMRKKKMSIV